MSTRALAERVGALPVTVIAETGFALFGIYVMCGGPVLFGGEAGDQGLSSRNENDPRAQMLLFGIYLVAVALSSRRANAWWRAMTADLVLVGLVGWTVASVSWSAAPEVTLRRALALVGTSFFGIYLTVRYSLESRLRLVGAGIGLVALYGWFVAPPELDTGGAFTGVFNQKNTLARLMALATVVFISMAWERRLRVVGIGGGVLSFALVVIARSASALVVVLTLLGLLPLFRQLKRDARLVVVLGITAILVLGIGVLFAAPAIDALTAALGRDPTFTGRTELWQLVLDMIRRSPWLGYGYEAFWLWGGNLRVLVDTALYWEPPHAHNGFLEVTLGTGVIGLVLFGFVLVRGAARAVIFIRRQQTPMRLWPLTYLCFYLLYNVTESSALVRNSITWVLFVSVLVSVSPAWARVGDSTEGVTSWAKGRRRRQWSDAAAYGRTRSVPTPPVRRFFQRGSCAP
jgi:exopolysaccharide production protein ExoQ